MEGKSESLVAAFAASSGVDFVRISIIFVRISSRNRQHPGAGRVADVENRRVRNELEVFFVENVADDLAIMPRGYDRSPEATPSAHLWRGALPTDLAAGEHRVEVRTFDAWQGEQRAAITYVLADVPEPAVEAAP